MNYTYKDNSSQKYDGVMAQQLEEIFPYAVHNPDSTDEYMKVDYSLIVPALIQSVQQQQKQISVLEEKISQLQK